MRIVSDSLAGRITVVLLIGLIASHVFSMAVYTTDRIELAIKTAGEHFTQQVSSVVRIFDKTPLTWHPQMIDAMMGPDQGISVTPVRQYIEHIPGSRQAAEISASLLKVLERSDSDDVVVQIVDKSAGRMAESVDETSYERFLDWLENQFIRTSIRELRASVRLRNGTWLNFRTHVPETTGVWDARAAVSTGLMGIGILILSLWIIRRVTAPLRVFTLASERLGRDVDAPPLVDAGPLEVRRATRAFNAMQRQIKRLVENRTQMLAAIAHDLRTPITLLRLRTEFVGDEIERGKMQNTLNEMEGMIASTLDFSRDAHVNEERRDIDLSALIGSVCDDFQDVGEDVVFKSVDNLVINGKPIALTRAVRNIVENAVKFGKSVVVDVIQTRKSVEIRITDDGRGIPESELEKVFLPFHRVEASRNRKTGGVGLGLSTARAIINEHGGDISLSNRPEGGLVVSILLPKDISR